MRNDNSTKLQLAQNSGYAFGFFAIPIFTFHFSVSLPHRLSRKQLKILIMKFFKNDQQEIKFNILATIAALLIYIILSTLRQLQ
jgi:hypothetical protein